MELAALSDAVHDHSSCAVGHKIYIVGGMLGDHETEKVRPNDCIYCLDMHCPQQWVCILLSYVCKRLNPVICQIGPESLIVSGGKPNSEGPISTFKFDLKSS